jgi:hypothetical protein
MLHWGWQKPGKIDHSFEKIYRLPPQVGDDLHAKSIKIHALNIYAPTRQPFPYLLQ